MSNVIQLAGNDRRISNKIHVDNLRSDEPEGVRFPLVVKDLHVKIPAKVSLESGGYDVFHKFLDRLRCLQIQLTLLCFARHTHLYLDC